MNTIRLLATASCSLMVLVTGCGTTSSVSTGLAGLNSKTLQPAGVTPQEVQRISDTLVTSYKADRVRDWNSHQAPPGEGTISPWGGGSIFGSSTRSEEVGSDEKLAKMRNNSDSSTNLVGRNDSPIGDAAVGIANREKSDPNISKSLTNSGDSTLQERPFTNSAPTELPPTQLSLALMKKVHSDLRDAAQHANRSHVEELYLSLGTRLRLAELGVEEDLAALQLDLDLLKNYLKEAK